MIKNCDVLKFLHDNGLTKRRCVKTIDAIKEQYFSDEASKYQCHYPINIFYRFR